MEKYMIGMLMTIMPVTFTMAQEEGATLSINTTNQDSIPTLSERGLRRQWVARRNLRYSILGGPSYTSDFGLLIGGSGLVTFRMSPCDTTQQRSVVPVAAAPMLSGELNLFSRPQLFFKGDRFRIFGQSSYRNIRENFYDVGYSTNKDYVRSDATSQCRYSRLRINPWFPFRPGESNSFAGSQVGLNYDHMYDPAKYLVDQPSYKTAGGTEKGYKNFSSGVGFLLTYNTHDAPANTYCGVHLDFRGMMYQKFLGSNNSFYRLGVDYRQYKALRKRDVLAWTAQSKNVFGDVPLNKYTLSGTPSNPRGYCMGQYHDKSLHVVMAEYRQMINTDKGNQVKRILSHVGCVAWAGCGSMGSNPRKIEGVLPNMGVGLRIEVQPRTNVRLDLGRNMVSRQNLFYFSMTGAF